MTWAEIVYTACLGAFMLGALGALLWSLPKVQAWWRPIYWMALSLAAITILLVVPSLFPDVVFLGGNTFIRLLRIEFALQALLLIAIPVVHRLEEKYLKRSRYVEEPSE